MSDSQWSTWALLGKSNITQICVGSHADGRHEVVGISAEGVVFHNWQTALNGDWSGWTQFGEGPASFVAVGCNWDRRLEVFLIRDGTLWHTWQSAPNGGWSEWNSLGRPQPDLELRQLRVVQRVGGPLDVFALTSTSNIWHVWQENTHPFGWGWSAWESVGPTDFMVNEFTVGRNSDGRLEIFAIDSGGTLWHRPQDNTDPMEKVKWSAQWWSLGRPPKTASVRPVVALNEGGWLEVITVGEPESGPNSLAYLRQVKLAEDQDRVSSVGWSNWSLWVHPGQSSFINLAAGQNQDGRVHIFASTEDGKLFRTSDTGLGWWRMEYPADTTISEIEVVQNQDGRVELFAVMANGMVGHLAETQPPANRLAWFNDVVQKVAPIVYLHPLEPYEPVVMESYLASTSYIDRGGTNRGPLTSLLLVADGPKPGADAYLQFAWGNQSIEKGDVKKAVAYAHVTPARDWSGGYDIQYWFASAFNGEASIGASITIAGEDYGIAVPIPPAGEHQGDLEHIVVRVDRLGNILKVYCSQHADGSWYDADSPSHRGFTLENGHPVIYSALSGHPSYVWAGDFPTPRAGIDFRLNLATVLKQIPEALLDNLKATLTQMQGKKRSLWEDIGNFFAKEWKDLETAAKQAEKAAAQFFTDLANDLETVFGGDIEVKGGLMNATAKGKRWDTSQSGAHALVGIDLPGLSHALSAPWWLQFRGRLGMLQPPLGDVLARTAFTLGRDVKQALPFLPDAVAEVLAYAMVMQFPPAAAVMLGITTVAGYKEGFAGPTAIKAKPGWLTGA